MDKKDIYQEKIQNIELLFNNLETKVDGIKTKINFSKQIKRYLVIQDKLKILSKPEKDIKSIEKQFISLENLNLEESKFFNQIKITESKIPPLKKQSEDLIILIDQKNQELISLIKKEKLNKENIEAEKSKLLIVKKEILKGNKDLKSLTNNLTKVNEQIAKLKKEKAKFVEKQFISLENLNPEETELLNQIEIFESEIPPLKKQLEALIILIDQKNQELIPLIKKEMIKNEKSKLLIVKKEILKENKDLKNLTNNLTKVNEQISKLRKEKAKFIEKQFISLERQNQTQLKLFKQVQFTESKISSLKRQLENLIILIDQNNEELVPIITSKEHKKTNLKSLIDKHEILNKEKYLKSLNNELIKMNDKILKQKKEKHSIIVLSYFKNQILKEIKVTKNFIKQANNINPKKIQLQLSTLQEEIDLKNSLVEKQIVNLAFAQKLMQKLDLIISYWNKENIYCKENIDIQYLNKNISRIENLFEKLQIEIILKKQEIKFEKTLKEYSKTKYELKKLNKRKTINNEVKQNIIKFQKIKQSQLKLLKTIETVEIKIFQLKKQLENIIFSIDRKKNQYEYFVANIEVQKNELELLIDEQKILEQTKQLKILDKELFKINAKILKLKSEKKPIMAFVYLRNQKNKEIRKIILFLQKTNQINLHKVQLKIAKFQKLINLRLPLITGEINNLELAQKLISKMDASISFGSEEDIDPNLAFSIKYLNIYYGYKHALYDVNIDIPKKGVTAIIGPSGCGKSTFIRTLNRINDQIPDFRVKGIILFDGEYNIYKLRSVINRYNKIDISTLRTKVGMIFQQPNPFPMSIYKNVTYGPKVRGIKNKAVLNDVVVKALKDAGLYEEVKDNLKVLGSSLSGGQQQRLCIARAIANEPEVLLMDEPTSALDPIAAAKVEELIHELKKDYTIIVVTHSMQQAKRLSDRTAFFYEGRLIEYRDTKDLFENPKEKETKEYISGKFG